MLFVVGACLAIAAMMPAPSHAAAKIQHLVSPGGIEAWFVQDATVPLVAMEFAMDGGAAQDPDGKAGVGNMVADLIDEGSGDLDSRAFHEHLDRRAIELSFSVTRDYFRGSLRMLKDNKDEAFDLLRMSLTSPHFDSADVERIRAQLISGLKRETSNPGSLASRKFLEIAYGDHPYGRPTGGSLESVPNITIADMKDYVSRVLTREHLKIAVVGDIDAASLGALLDRTFGGLPAKSKLVPVPDITASKPPQREFIALDVPQTVVTFGGPGIRRNDPNFMAALRRQSYSRRRIGIAALPRGSREARPCLFDLGLAGLDGSLRLVRRFDRNAGGSRRRNGGSRHPRDPPHGARRSDRAGTGRGQILPQGLADAIARYVVEARLRHAAISARSLSIDYLERRNALVDAVTIEEAKQAARRLWGDGLLTVIVGRAPEATAQPVAANAVEGELSLSSWCPASEVRMLARPPFTSFGIEGRQQTY